ncbi:DUF5701 family protein [Streptomyces sp. NPDC006367]|uniref:DUF5701 family protein n=1 Tax=unclassified Streptomyces TaxID=2593676 RepID=UPI0033B31CAD
MTSFDPVAEFDRRVRTLTGLGYPKLSRLTEERFTALLEPLRAAVPTAAGADRDLEAGRVPFVLAVTRELAPIEETMPRTALHGGGPPGFVDRSFEPGALERFTATPETRLPGQRAYLLTGVERGEEFCGVVPRDAMATITGRGRSPLTIEEGIALLTRFPELMVKNRCFSLGGSRSGDRRATEAIIPVAACAVGADQGDDRHEGSPPPLLPAPVVIDAPFWCEGRPLRRRRVLVGAFGAFGARGPGR